MPWKAVRPRHPASASSSVRAAVVYPFDPNEAELTSSGLEEEGAAQWRLQLEVGDVVVLREEEEQGWFFGHLLHNPGLAGVFPKEYVRVIQVSYTVCTS